MIPRFNTITFGKHSIKYLGLYPQHKLPIALRTLTEIDKFKKRLGKVIWLLTNVGGNAPRKLLNLSCFVYIKYLF